MSFLPLLANNTEISCHLNKFSDFNTKIFSRSVVQTIDDMDSWMKKMENKYFERNKIVRDACNKYRTINSSRIKLNDIMVDPFYRWAYCPNAKVATTTIAKLFTKLMLSEERPRNENGIINQMYNKCIKHYSNRFIVRKFFKVPTKVFHACNISNSSTNYELNNYFKQNKILSNVCISLFIVLLFFVLHLKLEIKILLQKTMAY